MINLYESMVPGQDWSWDPWICIQIPICNQTGYWLLYVAQSLLYVNDILQQVNDNWNYAKDNWNYVKDN